MQTFLHRIGAVAFLLGIGVLAGAVVAWFCGAGMSGNGVRDNSDVRKRVGLMLECGLH